VVVKCNKITWKFVEISIFVFASIGIVPEMSWHAWERLDTNKFTTLAIDWLAYMNRNTQTYTAE